MEKKGLVHIYTGDGKCKTTASVGLAVRAAGSGMKVLFVQFFKEDKAQSGEKELFRSGQVSCVELLRSNCRHPFFTGPRTDAEAVGAAVRECFESALKKVEESGPDLIVLDEIMAAINGGFLSTEEVLAFIENKPEGLEVVLTGRDAPVELVQVADYVTEMLKIKHPFDQGIKARKGIEY